jgi:hypothetical protein
MRALVLIVLFHFCHRRDRSKPLAFRNRAPDAHQTVSRSIHRSRTEEPRVQMISEVTGSYVVAFFEGWCGMRSNIAIMVALLIRVRSQLALG